MKLILYKKNNNKYNFSYIIVPHCKPAIKATPRIDISIDAGRSTTNPVKSANICMAKSFFETPPSTLRRNMILISIDFLYQNTRSRIIAWKVMKIMENDNVTRCEMKYFPSFRNSLSCLSHNFASRR